MIESFDQALERTLFSASKMTMVDIKKLRDDLDRLADCLQALHGEERERAIKAVTNLIPQWYSARGLRSILDYLSYRFAPELMKEEMESHYLSMIDPSVKLKLEIIIRTYYDLEWPLGIAKGFRPRSPMWEY